jgi:hypothetical protein
LRTNDPRWKRHRTEEIFFPGGRPRDLRQTAVVESDIDFRALSRQWPLPVAGNVRQDACRIVRDLPQQIDLEVQLAAPGLVVLSDLFYPGWEACVPGNTNRSNRSTRVPIVRTNRVMRGVYLPAGNHHLQFRYRPRRFCLGAAVSGIAWLAVGLLMIRHQRLAPHGFRVCSPRSPGPGSS